MCSSAVASDPRTVSPERTRASVPASALLMTRIERIGSTGAPTGEKLAGAPFWIAPSRDQDRPHASLSTPAQDSFSPPAGTSQERGTAPETAVDGDRVPVRAKCFKGRTGRCERFVADFIRAPSRRVVLMIFTQRPRSWSASDSAGPGCPHLLPQGRPPFHPPLFARQCNLMTGTSAPLMYCCFVLRNPKGN